MTFHNSRSFAQEEDQIDLLAPYRDKFYIPKHEAGEDCIYFCGNSLGLQPKSTPNALAQELKDWQQLAVEGHFHAKNPWMPYHELLTSGLQEISGALAHEVVAMNSLTTNLHLMMVSFYRPTAERYKILVESDAFPSDRYAVESQVAFHGYDPSDAIIVLKPREGEVILRDADICDYIAEHGHEIALVMMGGVNYYTGQFFDIKSITQAAHEADAMIGWDLAHAAGNVLLDLHNTGPDFAVWCTYKYLNSGPGSVGCAFVHDRHSEDAKLPRFTGWWGHDKETRFLMRDAYTPIKGAEAWQLSNPPILSLAAIKSSLTIFEEIGMAALRQKSIRLTNYFEYLLKELIGDRIEMITPSDSDHRGCQLSIKINNGGRDIHKKCIEKGLIVDWREPDVIRAAPVPLYNSYMDVYRAAHIIQSVLL